MSGSGRTDRPGAEAEPGETDCEALFLSTTLTSPDPEVLERLEVRKVLALRLEGERGPLLAVTESGEVAGSITGIGLARLIACVTEGFSYVAIVESIEDGRCDVEIRPE